MLAQTAYTVFLVVKYAGVAYLLYLAYRLWTAPPQAMDASAEVGRERPMQLFLGGYAFGASRARRFLSTPKTVRWVQRGSGVAMASAAMGPQHARNYRPQYRVWLCVYLYRWT
jgi:threonine/homoserine/homoserine lactone efflux protein